MSKFTFADCTRFDALIKDVFPGVDFKEVEYDELTTALKQVFEEANYEIIPNQVNYQEYFITFSWVIIILIIRYGSYLSSLSFQLASSGKQAFFSLKVWTIAFCYVCSLPVRGRDRKIPSSRLTRVT